MRYHLQSFLGAILLVFLKWLVIWRVGLDVGLSPSFRVRTRVCHRCPPFTKSPTPVVLAFFRQLLFRDNIIHPTYTPRSFTFCPGHLTHITATRSSVWTI